MMSKERNTRPFVEKDGYVENLISEATEMAISKRDATSWYAPFARVAAVVALILTIGSTGWMYMNSKKAQEAPLDVFLNSISDEEASMLENYYIEEICFYEWE